MAARVSITFDSAPAGMSTTALLTCGVVGPALFWLVAGVLRPFYRFLARACSRSIWRMGPGGLFAACA